MSKNKGERGPVIAPKFHHTTFTTRRLDEMVKWYEDVAGLRPVVTPWGRPAGPD